MPTDITMPKLGLTMDEGTVIRWLAAEGEPVVQGEPLLEVETDKVVIEVEAPASGVLGSLQVQAGEKAPVGALLARLYAAKEARERNKEEERRKIFSTPRARWRAHGLGLDWRRLAGTGPHGRVIERDVFAAAKHPLAESAEPAAFAPPPSPPATRESSFPHLPPSFGSYESPQLHLSVEVIAASLLELCARLSPAVEKAAGVQLTVTDLLARICGAALAQIPGANAVWEDGGVRLRTQVNVGIATFTGEADLDAPPLRDVDRKPLSQIASERAALLEKARQVTHLARNPQSAIDDLQAATFTLVDLGMFRGLGIEDHPGDETILVGDGGPPRVDSLQTVLSPSQSAILAAGRIAERPAVVDGHPAVRQTVFLTLSCDPRVFNAALAARFLDRVVDLIEEPYGLLI